MLNALSSSLNATDEKILYDRMKADSNNSMFYVGVNPEDSQKSMIIFDRVTKDLLESKRAFIEDSTIVDTFLNKVVFLMNPFQASRVRKSKDNIFGAPMAMILSHETHPEVSNLYTYRSRQGQEMGLIKGILKSKLEDAITQQGVTKTLEGYQCSDRLRSVLTKDLDQDWVILPLFFFKRFIFICLGIFVFSFYSVIAEYFYFITFCIDTNQRAIIPVDTTLDAEILEEIIDEESDTKDNKRVKRGPIVVQTKRHEQKRLKIAEPAVMAEVDID